MPKAVLSLLSLNAVACLGAIADQGAWEKVTTTGTQPPVAITEYHCMTAIDSDIFVSGGLSGGTTSNAFRLNTKTSVWSSLPNSQVSNIAADVVSSGGLVFMFGGRNATYRNDLYVLVPSDGDANANFTLLPQDQAVAGRNAHSVNVIGSSLYVFGGWNETRYFNDLYWLDTAAYLKGLDGTWNLANAPNGPAPRNAHSSVVYNGDLYVFGGFSHNTTHRVFTSCDQVLDNCVWFNDLWRFDNQNKAWIKLNPIPIEGVTGPRPRSQHSAEVIGEWMIVHGGQIVSAGDTNETWGYNFRTNSWTQWTPTTRPRVRGSGSAVVANQLYLWGGQGLSSDVWRFTPPVPNDKAPVESVIFNTRSIGIAVGFNLALTIILFIALVFRCCKGKLGGNVQDYESM